MEEFYLKNNGQNICVYKKSGGPVSVLLLHGAGLDSAMLSWREVIDLFPEKYTVYAIDLLGYGKSDRPCNMAGDSFYQQHIGTVEAVVRQLQLDQFVLSGLSMGGAIAIGYALKNPAQVKALVPVDSWGLVQKMPMHKLYYWYVNSFLTEVSYKWFAKYKWLVKWSISYSLFGEKENISNALLDEIFALCATKNASQSIKDYQVSSVTKQGVVPDFTRRLSGLKMPVLFINGEKDTLVFAKDAQKAAQAVAGGQIYIVKGCKHWAQKEKPEEYIKAVDEFLQAAKI